MLEREDPPSGVATIPERRELEPQGNRVVFYGWGHHDLNLESIPHIASALRSGLEARPRNATLFLETHFLPESNARHWERLVDALGGVTNLRIAQLIAETEHKLPDREEIEAKRKALMAGEITELVAAGYLPAKYASPIALALEIDALRREHPFDIAFESHPPHIARTLEAMQTDTTEFIDASSRSFDECDFEGVMRAHKSYVQLEHMIDSTRHKINLADLRRRLATTGDGSFIFVLAGARHLPLADQLKGNLSESDTTQVEVAGMPYHEMTETKLHQALDRGEEPDDLLYAQDFIEGIIGSVVLTELDAKSGHMASLNMFAHNFDQIKAATYRLATALSLDQIREMCVDHNKVYDYIEQSPLSGPLGDFIAKPKSTFFIREGTRQAGTPAEFKLPEGNALQILVDSKKLSLRDAQLLHLRFEEGLSNKDVAQRLNLAPTTTYQYTLRILKEIPEDIRGQLLMSAVERAEPEVTTTASENERPTAKGVYTDTVHKYELVTNTLQPFVEDGTLTATEAQVLQLKYGLGLSSEQVQRRSGINVTRQRIYQIGVSALKKLPKEIIDELRGKSSSNPSQQL